MALILSAVFWTLLWGPIGLLLSTPLTVCIIVLGIHIPKLSFLHVLLSDEKGIALYEEFYQHLVSLEFTEAIALINNHLKKNSLADLYDSTFIPVLSTIEVDRRNELLEDNQVTVLHQHIQMILDDLFIQYLKEKLELSSTNKNYNILCLPASTERDDIASTMLMQVLIAASFKANVSQKIDLNELFEFIEKEVFLMLFASRW